MPIGERWRRLSLVVGGIGACAWTFEAGNLVVNLYQRAPSTAHITAVREQIEQAGVRRDSCLNAIGTIPPSSLTIDELNARCWEEFGKEVSRLESIKALQRLRRDLYVTLTVAVIGIGIAFLLPWGAVRTIAWIVEGFRPHQ